MDQLVGYIRIHEQTGRMLPPPPCPAFISSSVNRRVESKERLLFPRGVALEDSLAGHVEFALRHEGIELALLEAALREIPQDEIARRIRANPNGEYVRRMAYYWEWFHQATVDAGPGPSARYIPLLDTERYIVVENPAKASRYRIFENQLGDRDFCPVIRRTEGTKGGARLLGELVAELSESLRDGENAGDLYQRALSYIYLSETRSSFRIEREEPSSSKEHAFVSLLGKIGERKALTEDWLVELQHLAVRNEFSHEFTFRGKQNWLDRDPSLVDYFPPAPEDLRPIMEGLMRFANDRTRKIDPIAKAAAVSFGFVYAHPFMDGNGRLHRFLLHHALAQSGLIPEGIVMPVSAVFSKNLDRYFDTLTAFSRPVTRLWEYRRADERPEVIRHPGKAPYSYWDATRETELVSWALTQAARVEVPREVRFLQVFDEARKAIDREMDIPSKDINLLVRFAIDKSGKLSANRRKQFKHLPEETLDRIEEIVALQLQVAPPENEEPQA